MVGSLLPFVHPPYPRWPWSIPWWGQPECLTDANTDLIPFCSQFLLCCFVCAFASPLSLFSVIQRLVLTWLSELGANEIPAVAASVDFFFSPKKPSPPIIILGAPGLYAGDHPFLITTLRPATEIRFATCLCVTWCVAFLD